MKTKMLGGCWKDESVDQIAADFQSDEPKSVEVLLAYYDYEDYSGSAFVLFRKEGKLHEVNGSHCSCYGLEGQWEPEETTVEAITHRLEAGHYGIDPFKSELRDVLDHLNAND